eukprot:768177-Hanusia_phi.AAC.10
MHIRTRRRVRRRREKRRVSVAEEVGGEQANRQAAGSGEDDAVVTVEEKSILSKQIKLKNKKTGDESLLACTAAFVAIGHDPNTKFVKGQVDMDANGYIKVLAGTTRTSVDGLFAAGDVADHVYRQVTELLWLLALTVLAGCDVSRDGSHGG